MKCLQKLTPSKKTSDGIENPEREESVERKDLVGTRGPNTKWHYRRIDQRERTGVLL